jgi:hypothetical protein
MDWVPIRLHVVLTWIVLVFGAIGCGRKVPELAVIEGSRIDLYTVDLQPLSSITTDTKIGSLSIAPNGKFLVYASSEGRAGMGHLFRVDLPTNSRTQLTDKPFYEPGAMGLVSKEDFPFEEKERYSDVAISPDSRFVVFAVHGVTDSDADDAIGLSGPLAVMDLGSRQKRIVKSTTRVDGNGAAYANNPVWSADSKGILLAFEIGGAIADVNGEKLEMVDPPPIPNQKFEFTSPVAWLSPKDVLFVRSTETERPGFGKLMAWNTESHSVSDTPDLLHIPSSSLTDVHLVQINSRYVSVVSEKRTEIFERSGKLSKSFPTARVYLRLFH